MPVPCRPGAEPRLVDHVRGEEVLHGTGDLADRALRRLLVVAERRADARGDRRKAVAALLHGDEEGALGGHHLVRHVEPPRLLVLLLGLATVAVDRRLQVGGGLAARVAHELEERAPDLRVRLADDRPDLAVVVLERVLLGRLLAGAHDEDQQDGDDQEAAEQEPLPDEDRAAIRRRARTGRTAPGTDACAGLVVLVEEGQKMVSSGLRCRRPGGGGREGYEAVRRTFAACGREPFRAP
jgi:hypothetical protein